jgi:lipopolysaccharide export system protein LptA
MLYTDATRQAIFRGPVSVDDQDGELRAREVTVYLTPKDQTVAESAAPAAPTAGAPITLGGKVDRIIAVGSVEVEQPGREATGERLVYTASDRVSVLTGTKDVPPKAVDPVQGTVIGAALRFRSGDDSVEVLSGTGSERVHTETHLRQKQ